MLDSSQEFCLPQEFTGSSGLGICRIDVPDILSPSHSLNQILCFARMKLASDIHLSVNTSIHIRRFGRLESCMQDILTSEKICAIVRQGLPSEMLKIFEDRQQ